MYLKQRLRDLNIIIIKRQWKIFAFKMHRVIKGRYIGNGWAFFFSLNYYPLCLEIYQIFIVTEIQLFSENVAADPDQWT